MNHNRPPSNRDDREFQKIFSDCPKSVDLTDDRHAELMLNTVESLLKKGYGISELQEFEKAIIKQNNTEIFILLALKIAKSKLLAASVSKPLFISVVFAVYKEHNRILNQSEHPHGEDFLLKKVMQLDWLFKDYPNINWELTIVDDGCPENSGRIAQKIIDKHDLNDRVRVLFLANAIEEDHAVVKPMTATSDSQKGGSIALGMWEANGGNRAGNHIVIYTDADLSTHLGQVMLLADPLINQGKLVAIGSRREPESVVIKKGTRNDRGKMFIYLWKRLIPNLGDIIDTQCGFKAFKSEIIPHVINDLIEKKFAFDIELLLKSELYQKGSVVKIPIAWIDSEAASTTTDLQPYLPMLKSIVRMNQKYFPDDNDHNAFAGFIESLDEETFQKILNEIPKEIVSRNPDEFTRYDGVQVTDFKKD